MRRIALLLAVLGMLLIVVVPAGADQPIYEVEFDINSHTGGGGEFFISGSATGNDLTATGEYTYYRPSIGQEYRVYDLKCVTVVPSSNTSYDTDYNVMIIGRLDVISDPDGDLDGYNWAYFAYAPDTEYISSRPIGVRPHVTEPSCDPYTYHNDAGYIGMTWRTAGHFDAGSWITVTEVLDQDGDGVLDSDDMCPATTLNDPPDELKKNRFAADEAGLFADKYGTESGFSLVDTYGCDEDQIISAMSLGKGHEWFGITRSVLLDFISMYSD